ncbi:MFS transporter [Candidatus Sodalis endolongispinus]|uniref:MFS transporter n=2 Tax=Candidatus Sodalis endolongispinus TaxID=2812662 RepID=A0ABS5YAF9_9GAMM|nr:MFS transporter [Candidatus Sodalis endolongispinus]
MRYQVIWLCTALAHGSWIARIMITWGIISGMTAFISGEYSFFTIRFLLGMAEAGFFPGVVYYFSYWLPAKNRARVLSVFYLAVPFAVVFGSLISAPLLMMHGVGGLEGWQWLFIIEALPAFILGIYLFFRLKDKPEQATWLDDEEKAWLTATLNSEKANLATPGQHRLGKVFADPRVIKLSLVYFGMNFAGVGLIMFLPQIVAGFGSAISWVGVIAAIPYFVAAVLLPFIGRYSDRHPGNRALQSGCSAAAVAIGLALCVFISNPVAMLLLICLAAIGIYAFGPAVLGAMLQSFCWLRLCGGHRGYQFRGEFKRRRRPLCDGVAAGHDRQFCLFPARHSGRARVSGGGVSGYQAGPQNRLTREALSTRKGSKRGAAAA